MKKTIALILSFVLIIGILPMSVFAAETEQRYTTYCRLGDSNAAAYGLTDYWSSAADYDDEPRWYNYGTAESPNLVMNEKRLVNGSYGQLIAEALGIEKENISVDSHSGFRTQEILRVLDREVVFGDTGKYTDEYGDFFLSGTGFWVEDAFLGLFPDAHEHMVNGVTNADIITLNVGCNDIFTGNMYTALNSFVDVNTEYGYLLDFSTDKTLEERFAEMLDIAAATGEISEILVNAFAGMEKGYRSFVKYMPELINKIKELNPDATVIVYSLFNPYLMIDDLLPIDVYDYFDLMTSRANTYLKSLCSDNFLYTDITDNILFGFDVLDTSTLKRTSDTIIQMSHPSAEGHKYMAEQALAVLEKYDGAPENLTVSKAKLSKTTVLTWDRTSKATAYRIYRSTSENGNYNYIGSSVNSRFIDLTAKRNTEYFYKVQAVFYDNTTTRLSAAVK